MYQVLIVDDDVALTNYLMVFMVQSELYEPTVTSDSREVPGLLTERNFDVIILDMDMPHLNGIELLKLFREREIDTPVVVLSGFNDADMAVKALRLGAFDYLAKPVDDEHLLEVLNKAITSHCLQSSVSELPSELSREDLDNKEAFTRVKTQDPEMIHLLHQAEKMAEGNLSILITGEPGTGKSTLARAIHEASPRAGGPFIGVNVTDHDQEQFAAVLFGQVRGWSGAMKEQEGLVEQADKGTLFLANIDGLAMPLQERLDHLLETGEYHREGTNRVGKVDLRLISASCRDLASAIRRNCFSRELLYHLRVNRLEVPPLRRRPGDIPLLAQHFMKREVQRSGLMVSGFDPELGAFLQEYSFPGNQEELNDIIVTALRREKGETLGIASLSRHVRERIRRGRNAGGEFEPRPLAEVIREHARNTVEHLDGDLNRAAAALGIGRPDLERYLAD